MPLQRPPGKGSKSSPNDRRAAIRGQHKLRDEQAALRDEQIALWAKARLVPHLRKIDTSAFETPTATTKFDLLTDDWLQNPANYGRAGRETKEGKKADVSTWSVAAPPPLSIWEGEFGITAPSNNIREHSSASDLVNFMDSQLEEMEHRRSIRSKVRHTTKMEYTGKSQKGKGKKGRKAKSDFDETERAIAAAVAAVDPPPPAPVFTALDILHQESVRGTRQAVQQRDAAAHSLIDRKKREEADLDAELMGAEQQGDIINKRIALKRQTDRNREESEFAGFDNKLNSSITTASVSTNKPKDDIYKTEPSPKKTFSMTFSESLPLSLSKSKLKSQSQQQPATSTAVSPYDACSYKDIRRRVSMHYRQQVIQYVYERKVHMK